MIKERKTWIDVLKGIGILLVIYGHIDTSYIRDIIFLFHMPLFFFLGGYLYTSSKSMKCFIVKKSRELAVPYITFLILLSFPFVVIGLLEGSFEQVINSTILPMLLGGRSLTGWLSVFWFVSCYFCTLLLYYFLVVNVSQKLINIICIVFSLLAFINAAMYPDYWLIFNLNVVLISLPIFHVGNLCSRLGRIEMICLFVLLSLVSVFFLFNGGGEVDYKYSKYGTPIVGQCVSLFFIFVLAGLSKLLVLIPRLNIFLSYIGSASLTLMFLHQPIQISFRKYFDVTCVWENFVLTLLLSLCVFAFLKRQAISRKYFLGKY